MRIAAAPTVPQAPQLGAARTLGRVAAQGSLLAQVPAQLLLPPEVSAGYSATQLPLAHRYCCCPAAAAAQLRHWLPGGPLVAGSVFG